MLPPNPRRIDLHLHTTRSDGACTPAEVLARCARAGLDLVALSDHDLCCDLAVGEHVIEGKTIHLLGAAEVSGVHAGKEQHLLVYFAGEIPQAFREFCATQVAARVARYEAAVTAIGLPLPAPDEAARNGERALTRHHLARALVAGGHCKDLREAFSRYVGGSSSRVPQVQTRFVDAIALARDLGAVTSWAHPVVDDVRAHVEAFASAGLHALEGMRPGLSAADRRFYRQAAKRHGLFLTGGSDWHGWHEPQLGLFFVEPRDLDELFAALAG